MRRLLVWTWKEWRDRRAVLLGIAVAIPALTAAAFWAFSERLAVAAAGSVGVRIDAEVVTFSRIFHLVALGMVGLAVASDLFAGDLRGGSLAVVRRVPRGVGLAFAAKWLCLALASLAALLWQGACLAVAWSAVGLPDAGARSWDALWLANDVWVPGLALVLAAWVALVSSWLPSSGAAAGGGILLLGALLLPGWWILSEHAYVLPWAADHRGLALLLLGLVPVVAAAVSFLCGTRFCRGAWSAAWRGLVVLAVAFGGTYAWAGKSLADFIDFAPGDEGVWLADGILGADGCLVHVNAYRGARLDAGGSAPRSPPRAWTIDLASGAARALDVGGTWVDRVPGAWSPSPYAGYFDLGPAPYVVSRRTEDNLRVESVAWVDASSGEVLRVLPPLFQDEEILGWTRASLRAASTVRDVAGNVAWLRMFGTHGHRVFERDGRPAAAVPRAEDRLNPGWWRIPGGWFRPPMDGQGARVLDATTGEARSFDLRDGRWPRFVSPTRWVWQESGAKGAFPARSWVVGEVATGEERLAANPPEIVGTPLDGGRLLSARRDGDGVRLVLWDPAAGHDEEVAWAGAAVPDLGNVSAVGYRGDLGLHLLQLGHADGRSAFAVLDGADRSVRAITSWGPGFAAWHPIALLAGGALLAIEDGRRIVRLGPALRERDVLFPRE